MFRAPPLRAKSNRSFSWTGCNDDFGDEDDDEDELESIMWLTGLLCFIVKMVWLWRWVLVLWLYFGWWCVPILFQWWSSFSSLGPAKNAEDGYVTVNVGDSSLTFLFFFFLPFFNILKIFKSTASSSWSMFDTPNPQSIQNKERNTEHSLLSVQASKYRTH